MSDERYLSIFLPGLYGGGAEKVMLSLAKLFVERGCRVDLVLSNYEGVYKDDVPEGVRVVDLGGLRTLASLPRLAAYLKQNRPDSMIATISHANIVALWAKLLARVPTRIIVREANTSGPVGRSMKVHIVESLLKKVFYRFAHKVVAVSEDVAKEVWKSTGIPPENVRVVYNPLLVQSDVDKASSPLRGLHPCLESKYFVVGVGRLTRQKGFSTLIEAFSIVRQSCDASLIILGEGELRGELENQIESLGLQGKVWMPGFVEKPHYYVANSDVFVLSSAWEGLPNALLEAMALDVPVIATDCKGGCAEILKGGEIGKLVEPGNVKQMAEEILVELSVIEGSKQNLSELKKRCEDFSPAKIANEYLSFC